MNWVFFWCIFLKGIIYGGQVIPSTLQLSLKFVSHRQHVKDSGYHFQMLWHKSSSRHWRFQDEGIQTNCNDPLAFSSPARVSRACSFFPPDSVFVSTVTAYKSIRVALVCRQGISAPAVPSRWPEASQFSQIQPVIHLIWDQVENGSCHRDFIDGCAPAGGKRAPVSVRRRTGSAPSLPWCILWTQRRYQLLIVCLMWWHQD